MSSRHKQAAVRSPRPKPFLAPKRHNLDRHAQKIIAENIDADDDELLTTREVADWFRVSEEWLEIGRSKNYGPKFTRVGPHMIRYRRGDCRKFLQARTHSSTAEYSRRARRVEQVEA
jgi:hypothetical protein